MITTRPNSLPGPFLYGSYASSTFPFRVRGTQVHVSLEGQPNPIDAPGALVFRQPAEQPTAYEPFKDLTGKEYTTDSQGYLQGRGELYPGDRLVALAPITTTDTYSLYYTSATPTLSGLDTYAVVSPGVQNLTASSSRPLVLYNLTVSLEWDATNDLQFLAQLQHDLQRTSELLYDWTNGQAALGKITVYQNRDHWNDAHIRIYASNHLRPNAAMGGVVSQTASDPSAPIINYEPGQVAMGSIWNRYGDPSGSLGEDWPRGLAHELGHYLLYLDDDYLGLDAQGFLKPVETCPSAMSDPYRDDYSEFHSQTGWNTECADTLAQKSTGRSDWETISTFYPALSSNPPNPGPITLPLDVTEVILPDPTTGTLSNPIFFLTYNGARVQSGSTAQAFLFQGDHLIDLGSPTNGEILARGARPGDNLCVFEPGAQRSGCLLLVQGNVPLPLVDLPTWQPTVLLDATDSSTFTVTVNGVPSGLPLLARIYSPNDPAPAAISLTETSGTYSGTFHLPSPIPEGYVRIYLNDDDPRQALTNYTLGGSPARSWGRWARSWGRFVPAISSDGQLILFGNNLNFPEGEFYGVQALTLPANATPSWNTIVGQTYHLFTSAGAPSLTGSSIAFGYLGRDVPPLEEQWLTIYYSQTGNSWTALPTSRDISHNIATAPTQGPGFYTLMTAFEISLHGPGWNLISYPIPDPNGQIFPIQDIFASIAGNYTTIYGYDSYDTADAWKVYDVSAPYYVNDLTELKFASGYWIYVTQDIILRLKGSATLTSMDKANADFGYPPSTFYGPVNGSQTFVPVPGMAVTAWIDGNVCGQGKTLEYGGMVVYTINVFANDISGTSGCGSPGKRVEFRIESQHMATITPWDNLHVRYLPLENTLHFFLPITIRN